MRNSEYIYISSDYGLLKNTTDLIPEVAYKNMALRDGGALDSGIIPCKKSCGKVIEIAGVIS